MFDVAMVWPSRDTMPMWVPASPVSNSQSMLLVAGW